MREYLRTLQKPQAQIEEGLSREELLSQLASLRQELEQVQQEKADLELLLQTTVEHSSTIEASLHDEAEKARRESEERFRAIAEATPIPVLLSRVSDGVILYANVTASSTFGLPIEQLLGRQATDFYYDPSDQQRLMDIFADNGYVRNYEIQAKRADGTLFWVMLSLQSLMFKGESTLLCTLVDITDRKQAEEELARAKDQLRAVLDAVPGSISWVGADGLYLGVNRYLSESLNLPPDAFVGQELGFLNNSSKFAEFMRQFLASPETATSQEIGVQVNDSMRYYLLAAQKYQQGNATVSVGIDITERKKAEEALRIAEENYRSIFENALEGIFQATPDGHYISVNPAMARIYGYSSPEEMIASVTEIGTQIYVDPNCRDKFKRWMAEQGEVKDFEYQAYQKDGSIIWVEEDTRAVRNTSGELLYYEGIVQDITKRKQEQEALKRQVQELRIEIDKTMKAQKVAEIVETDSFKNLKQKLQKMKALKAQKEKHLS